MIELTRRVWLGGGVAVLTGGAWTLLSGRRAGAGLPAGGVPTVRIVKFDDRGESLDPGEVPKVVKSEEEWRRTLSRGQYYVTRDRKSVV